MVKGRGLLQMFTPFELTSKMTKLVPNDKCCDDDWSFRFSQAPSGFVCNTHRMWASQAETKQLHRMERSS